MWNAAGLRPPNLEGLGDNVWVGNQNLPTTEQGLIVLGTPLGTPQYQQHQLQQLRAQHDQLLDRIRVLFCASSRCNYQLRMLRPEITTNFAAAHDVAVATCFTQLLDS